MAYAAGFYANMGNYFSHGGMKFIPEISTTDFRKILMSHPLARKNSHKGRLYRKVMFNCYLQIHQEIFNIDKPYRSLGFH